MSKRIAVTIQTYGDFDMLTTAEVMLSPLNMKPSEVRNIVGSIVMSNVSQSKADNAIKELKSYGFTALKSMPLMVGGNV